METSLLTAERFRELVIYDAETCRFIWRERCAVAGETRRQAIIRGAWNAQWAGKSVARRLSKNPTKYQSLYSMHRVLKRYYGEHRLVWLYFKGAWPKNMIDHVDGNTLNNRLSNLREATRQQNGFNRPVLRSNKLGVKGVHYDAKRNKYVAQHRFRRSDGGKTTRMLGRYSTLQDAAQAYAEHAKLAHGVFMHDSLNRGEDSVASSRRKTSWRTPNVVEIVIDPQVSQNIMVSPPVEMTRIS